MSLNKDEYITECKRILFERFYRSDNIFEAWLDRKNFILEDFSPRELIESGRGEKVLQFLEMFKGD